MMNKSGVLRSGLGDFCAYWGGGCACCGEKFEEGGIPECFKPAEAYVGEWDKERVGRLVKSIVKGFIDEGGRVGSLELVVRVFGVGLDFYKEFKWWIDFLRKEVP